MSAIRVAVAIDRGLDSEGVRHTVARDPGIEVVAYADGFDEDDLARLSEASADLTVVACNGGGDHALAVISQAVALRPDRPVVVIGDDPPEGFVERAFAAGAQDIMTLPPAGTASQEAVSAQILFGLEKVMARRRSAGGAAALGSLICILGPKGGTGKTLTTTNLGAALAERGQRVVVVDLDLQFGDVGLALRLAPERTSYDLASSSGSLDAEKVDAYLSTHPTGMRVLIAPSRPDQAAAVTTEVLQQIYPLLRQHNDFILVDTPPGFTPEVITSIDAASDCLMVGTLDSLSLKNTRLGLETLDLMGFDRSNVRVVLNRADSRVGIGHGDVLAIIGRPPDVLVPSHRNIARSMNDGVPISVSDRRSEAGRAFHLLAGLYLADRAPKPAERRREAHGERRRRWFRRGEEH
jgi:pilus assembly protein CpaE